MWPVYPTLSKTFLAQNRDVCAQHSYHVLLAHLYTPAAVKTIIYKAASRFVDALLHLGRTQGRCVSAFETLKLILGSSTLKMKAKTDYLGGEKFYTAHFKTYRSLCAFVFAFMPPQKQETGDPLARSVDDIHKLFNLASSTRQLLLGLHTQNVKKKKMFFDHTLIKIPDWIHETTEPAPHVWGEGLWRFIFDERENATSKNQQY